ncbi:hypothetical protein BD410DRAFT_791178 [Rickenella mellea]|uniref:Uncharacterized protein n=1 Tax=Rickenella mellea TaxID=50990 RepID=A0A4Y7PYK1_9AGAM|nr:hypothetical protein BD410DRAFT_791178 [Rickenella mellea]
MTNHCARSQSQRHAAVVLRSLVFNFPSRLSIRTITTPSHDPRIPLRQTLSRFPVLRTPPMRTRWLSARVVRGSGAEGEGERTSWWCEYLYRCRCWVQDCMPVISLWNDVRVHRP